MLLNRLPLITTLVLCVAILGGLYVQLAPMFLKGGGFLQGGGFFQAEGASPTKTSPANPTSASAPKETKKTYNIANFKLFGDAKAVVEKPKPIAKDLPKTKLKLVLTGVMASGKAENASALIQGPDKETLNYRINDELPGGAILKQIFPERVVLERSGRLENLVFLEKRPIGIESYIPEDEPEEETASNVTPTEAPTAANRPNPGRTQGIKDRLSKLRKRMLKNRTSP